MNDEYKYPSQLLSLALCYLLSINKCLIRLTNNHTEGNMLYADNKLSALVPEQTNKLANSLCLKLFPD